MSDKIKWEVVKIVHDAVNNKSLKKSDLHAILKDVAFLIVTGITPSGSRFPNLEWVER